MEWIEYPARLDPTFAFYVNDHVVKLKKALQVTCKAFVGLVAGREFEPLTFASDISPGALSRFQ
jgi:hypothetical protein